MMFVCEKCMTTVYVDVQGFGGSWGPCEYCGEVSGCRDIHHSHLQFRRSYAIENFDAEKIAFLSKHNVIGPPGS